MVGVPVLAPLLHALPKERLHLFGGAAFVELVHLHRERAPQAAREPAQGPLGDQGVCFLGGDKRLLELFVDVTLQGGEKGATHLYAFGAQGQGGNKPPGVGDPARRDHGHVDGVGHRRRQDHGGDLIRPIHPAGLIALRDDDVRAGILGRQCLLHIADHVHDGESGVFEPPRVQLGVAARLGDHRHPFLDKHLDVAVRDVGEDKDGEVDAEGLVGKGLGPADVLADVLRTLRERRPSGVRRHHAQSAAVGDRRGELTVTGDRHAAFYDRVLDPEDLRDSRLPHGKRPLGLIVAFLG